MMSATMPQGLEPNSDTSNSENTCRVVSLIYPSAEKKLWLSELNIGFTIYGVDPVIALEYLRLRESKKRVDPKSVIFSCRYGCTTEFYSIRELKGHIEEEHAAELWKACDKEQNGAFFKELAFPLVFACPFSCGATDLEYPELVDTHVWVFHTSKPEEQQWVPDDDLEIAERESVRDDMKMGTNCSYYKQEPRAKRLRLV